jgi:hypothetical protein
MNHNRILYKELDDTKSSLFSAQQQVLKNSIATQFQKQDGMKFKTFAVREREEKLRQQEGPIMNAAEILSAKAEMYRFINRMSEPPIIGIDLGQEERTTTLNMYGDNRLQASIELTGEMSEEMKKFLLDTEQLTADGIAESMTEEQKCREYGVPNE